MAKILVIDDNGANRDLLDRYLGRRGYEVIHAVDGAMGLLLVWTHYPDLVLLDLSMPVFDGWDTIRQLKATAETRDIPVIAVTALTLDDTHERALAAGCDDYVSKPVDLPGLLGKIESWLQPRAGQVPPALRPASALRRRPPISP